MAPATRVMPSFTPTSPGPLADARLTAEQTREGSADDGEIERRYAMLRELQAAAARDSRVRFESSLAMPIDAGQGILATPAL